MVLLIAVYAFRYCRSAENSRNNMRGRMALFLILFEIFKQCVVGLTGAPALGTLPLEICSFAEYTILADAFWPKNRLFKQLMAFAFLPASLMALAFPTVTAYPPVSFFAIHQFVLHAGIAAYIIAQYTAGEIRPRYAGLWLSVLVIGVLAVPMYLLDLKFGLVSRRANTPSGQK